MSKKNTRCSQTSRDYLPLNADETVSIFESVRSYGGVIFRLEDHLERLAASARTAGIRLSKSPSQLKEWIYRSLRNAGRRDAFLRLTVTTGGDFVIVTTRAYPPEVYRKGVTLVTATVRKNSSRSFYPEAKTSSYAGAVMATSEMPSRAFEVLFLGEEGYVRETRTSNIFMVKENVLFTPSTIAILDGVTRRTVMEIARAGARMRVCETQLTRHELYNADEVFLTNTSGELIPVREIDCRTIGTGKPGAVTLVLRRLFRQCVREYREKHSSSTRSGTC